MGEIHCLFADFHFAIQAALLRHIAYFFDIALGDSLSLKEDFPAGRDGDSVDDADEGGFSRSVRSEQAEDFPFGDFEAHIVESHLRSEGLAYVFDLDD